MIKHHFRLSIGAIKILPLMLHSSYITTMTSSSRRSSLRSGSSKDAIILEVEKIAVIPPKERKFGKRCLDTEPNFVITKKDKSSITPVIIEKEGKGKVKENKILKNNLEPESLSSAAIHKTTVESVEAKSVSSIESSKKKKRMNAPLSPPLAYQPFDVAPNPVPTTGEKYMGCHVSAAGGIWNSFENGIQSSAKSIAMFLRNQRSWNAKPLDQPTVEKWNAAKKGFPPHLILPHGSYLMNLGSPKEETLKKSRDLLIEELKRCEMLGIPHFNFHPGSSLGEIARSECCSLIAESINLAHKETQDVICVIENMSKQGFTIGGDFNEIRHIIDLVDDKTRVGVCLDTCHSHAAGYDLSSEKGFETFLSDFEKCIGWKFLRGLHINDSKGKSGDHLDRHENIGKGTIGIEGFRRIMNCPHFNDIPLILETPFIDEKTYGKEIALLESLVKKS